MPAPQREDYDSVLRALERRVARLERALGAGALVLPNASVPPVLDDGGAVFVQAGALHYIGSSGTNTQVAPA